MIKYILVTVAIVPPATFAFLWLNIKKPGWGYSKADAQREALRQSLHHPFFWMWLVFVLVLVGVYTGTISTILRWLVAHGVHLG